MHPHPHCVGSNGKGHPIIDDLSIIMPRVGGTSINYGTMYGTRVVTYRANNHSIETFADGGLLVTKVLRDSTAERPHGANRNKRKHSDAVHLALPSAPAAPSCVHSSHAAGTAAGPKRASTGRPTVTDSRYAATKRWTALLSTEKVREQAADEARVARWVSTCSLSTSTAPSAEQRMVELKARLQAKRNG